MKSKHKYTFDWVKFQVLTANSMKIMSFGMLHRVVQNNWGLCGLISLLYFMANYRNLACLFRLQQFIFIHKRKQSSKLYNEHKNMDKYTMYIMRFKSGATFILHYFFKISKHRLQSYLWLWAINANISTKNLIFSTKMATFWAAAPCSLVQIC